MSGKCVPPAYGSLSDPDLVRAPARGRATAATASGIAPRWTGMCSACATMRPAASKSAVEQSRRSLMFDENAERTSAAPISSATARSAAADHLELDGDHRRRSRTSVPCRSVSPAQPAGTQQRRTGRIRRGSGPSTAVCVARRARPGPGHDLRRAHGDELDCPVAVGVPVALFMRGMEAILEARAERDGQLEGLASRSGGSPRPRAEAHPHRTAGAR